MYSCQLHAYPPILTEFVGWAGAATVGTLLTGSTNKAEIPTGRNKSAQISISN